ncbi:MAG TPA: CopD family protein [Stellaceae bacterium]|nr:CopD family protein [Stellaceae bacterium]
MALLLDIFGFLSVVLRGLVLTAQSLTIGGVVFLVLLAYPLRRELGASGAAAVERCCRLLLWSALAFAALELTFVMLECVVLAGTVDISLAEALGAAFARFGLIAAAASAVTAALVRRPPRGLRVAALPVLALVMLLAQAATSHAAAQLSHRAPLLIADLLHMGAAAAWIGGIPYLLLALGRTGDRRALARIGRRFSLIALGAVALLIAAGLAMAVPYIGSIDAIYGTAYGVMVVTKALLLLGLLCLGGMNYLLVERLRRVPGTPIVRLRRFAEVEIGLGISVLFAAASLTSQPPAVDLTTDRASLHEIVERLTPHWPRLASPAHASLALSELQAKIDAAAAANAPRPQAFVPGEGVLPPRNAEDIAWSEYNHHWAGLFVLAIGLLTLAERTGHAPWARHWPLLFIGLAAFLFIRSDPEVWPLGDIGFFASLRDPEIVQHRIFVALIAAFGFFEWRVRAGTLRGSGAALVFPLITALGGVLLLTHSHALSNIKEQLLIEITHVPLALCGITAGWARWLELRLDEPGSRIASWIWPIAFVLVGIILLLYREA